MFNIRKILVPVEFADVFPRPAVLQAAWLARKFKAEIILMHVVTPFSYPAGLLESGHQITARDLHAHIVQRAQDDLDGALRRELDGVAVTRILRRGEPAREIVRAASDTQADLIVLPTRGTGEFYRLLLGSVTAKVLHESQCPIWTGAHLEETSGAEFTIRNVLCSVNLSPHSRHTASFAASLAAAVGATLTLVHITGSLETFGPGGFSVNPEWKEKLVGFAAKEIAALQEETGIKAAVIIDSGNVPQLLNRAAEQSKADVMVIGHIPGRSHLGDNGNGYGIIRESHVPVLSV